MIKYLRVNIPDGLRNLKISAVLLDSGGDHLYEDYLCEFTEVSLDTIYDEFNTDDPIDHNHDMRDERDERLSG